ncbi:MAG: hypothetical protein R3F59_33925, partial [Myxococcota bacterium]
NDAYNDLYLYQGPTAFHPTAQISAVTLNTNVRAQWNILAAASWALHRRSGGLSGETLTYYTQTCPTATASAVSCYTGTNGRVYIDPVHDEFKFIVAHETGHYVARLRNSGVGANTATLGSPDGNCQAADGPMIQKRYTSLAASEGLAWYFSAVAFNQTDESDCDFYRTGHDWDQDFNVGENGTDPNDELTPSCQGKAAEGWAVWDYINYECGGTLEDRGTYIDWMRAFWDADAGYGVTTTEIFDLWVEADPSTWDADGGSGCDVDEDPCDPEERLQNAADRLGIGTEWGYASAANGVR